MKVANYVCITGADGYIGRGLAARYLQLTEKMLLLILRADSPEEITQKSNSIYQYFPAYYHSRIKLYFTNLAQAQNFIDIDRKSIITIIHTAAITRFNVEAEMADKVNRDGTLQILQLAESCPNLQRYLQVGTVYASGLASGLIDEQPLANTLGFANHYERSKWEAERLLLQNFPHLPWILPRVATIVADNAEGAITQYNVFHNTLRLLYMGLTSIMPGEKDTPLYFVAGDFVINSLYFLAEKLNVDRKIFHICQPAASSITIGQLIDLVFSVFSEDENFRKRRILKPLLSNYTSFEALANTLDGMAGLVVRQALESMRPFAKQMFVQKNFLNQNLCNYWSEYYEVDQVVLLQQVVKNLMATRWGSKPLTPIVEEAL